MTERTKEMKYINLTLNRLYQLLLVICLAACSEDTINDYSLFPQGTVLSGKLTDGQTLYLVRTDSINMSGICFVHSNQAIVNEIPFTADSLGEIIIEVSDNYIKGQIKVEESLKEINMVFPGSSAFGMENQKIRLTFHNKLLSFITCPGRYSSTIFDEVIVQKDILYGTAPGFYTSKPLDKIANSNYEQVISEIWNELINTVFVKGITEQDLYMDVYQPEYDLHKNRPVLLFIHGGAFYFGDKENATLTCLMDNLVKRGYVVVSINYRLGSTALGYPAFERSIYRGVQDTNAALRYIAHHSKSMGINPNQIFVAGSSAGAVIALVSAFMEQHEAYSSAEGNLFRDNLGKLNASGNDLDEQIRIAGLISMWGGISDLNFIDDNMPTLLFHGTNDDIVPCDEGLPFKELMGKFIHNILSSSWKLYGSKAIYNYMRQQGMSVKYLPFRGYGHEPQVNDDGVFNENMDTILEEINRFLYEQISKQYNIEGNPEVQKFDSTPVYRINNLDTANVIWQVEGGCIIEQRNDYIKIVWYGSNNRGKIIACITDDFGISYNKEMTINIKK
jgi:acetyl esterase/lipase